jgi:UDP-N-acetyl-D-mannosaminuronate dehydrogenase
MSGKVIVIGLGEIGRPLFELVKEKYETIGVDIDPVDADGLCDILHVCFPFNVYDFVGSCVDYIAKYRPSLTIINSTVSPGTSRRVHELSNSPVVHSPIRGKHMKMMEDLLSYTKFVGGINQQESQKAARHFDSIGLKTKILSSPESTELAKLTETTYFGLLIAWAQEVERYSEKLGLDYDEIVSFYTEILFFPPVKYFPGYIDGHCVMPNVKILKDIFASDVLKSIERSNEMKAMSVRLTRQKSKGNEKLVNEI